MSPATEYRFENASGDLLVHLVMEPGSAPSGWEASYMFVQPELEHILRDRLGELVGVTAWYGAECVDLVQTDNAAELTVRRAGRTETVRARFAVGCDGASSFVRNALGVVMDDLGFDEPWVVIDTKPKRDIGLDPATAYQFCNPASADDLRACGSWPPAMGIHAVARRDARVDRDSRVGVGTARTVGRRSVARTRARGGLPISRADRAAMAGRSRVARR